MRRAAVTIATALALAGCSQTMKLSYESPPVAPSTAELKPVGIAVVDKRRYVEYGDKDPWYLGTRSRGDDTRDLNIRNKLPLAHELRKDVIGDLAALGFKVSGDADIRQLTVEIHDWRVQIADAARLTYDLRLEVTDGRGTTVLDTRLKEDARIEVANLEPEVNAAYVKLVRRILRDNGEVRAAISR